MLDHSIQKIIALGKKFLQGSINGDDFKWAYYDIYYYEIKKFEFLTTEEKNIFYELEYFQERISYYCSIPELRTKDNLAIDEQKLGEITKEIIEKLNKYVEKYGITNLWKLNVSKDWRIIYTIQGNEIEVISIILESLSHKEYERKFGY